MPQSPSLPRDDLTGFPVLQHHTQFLALEVSSHVYVGVVSSASNVSFDYSFCVEIFVKSYH